MPAPRVLPCICILVLWMACGSVVHAAKSVTITLDKDSIKGEDEVHISASLSGFLSDEVIKIKGAFFLEGSSNYFGYTKNGDAWIKCGDTTANQMEMNLSQWNNQLILRSDFGDSGFSGEGEYRVKVGYYSRSSSGTYGSVSWSNALPIIINLPDPTSTPIPTSTPLPTPTKTPSPSAVPPTSLPTQTPTTQKEQPTNTPYPTVPPTGIRQIPPHASSSQGMFSDVLGSSAEPTIEGLQDQPVASDSSKEKLRMASTALAFIGMGLAVLSIAKSIEAWQQSRE